MFPCLNMAIFLITMLKFLKLWRILSPSQTHLGQILTCTWPVITHPSYRHPVSPVQGSVLRLKANFSYLPQELIVMIWAILCLLYVTYCSNFPICFCFTPMELRGLLLTHLHICSIVHHRCILCEFSPAFLKNANNDTYCSAYFLLLIHFHNIYIYWVSGEFFSSYQPDGIGNNSTQVQKHTHLMIIFPYRAFAYAKYFSS